ncbi:MAG: PQQ-binding-like beta-propeller repeat protein [Nitrososphaerota archaeon]
MREVRVGGVLCKILFAKTGYTPHYTEHVQDPVTGEDVLVMADPHSRRSAIIYNPDRDKIVWEYRVGGEAVNANPHIARLITERVPKLRARPGDLICADRDNRFIVVDRRSKRIKWSFRPADARWSHDSLLTADHEGLIITDYATGYIRRIDFEGRVVWSRNLGKGLAKLSRIAGATPSGIHSNSFGGDVLATVNQSVRGVYELDEETGEIVWSCPPPKGSKNVTLTLKPHAAVRTGLAEMGGNLTVFNQEAGGGLLAVDKDCRPRWGWIKPLIALEGQEHYRPSAVGLYETTHVFLTNYGTIGFIDWNFPNLATVYEMLEIPVMRRSSWLLAWSRRGGPREEFLDPPIETGEWDVTSIHCRNHGRNPMALDIYATYGSYVDTGDAGQWRLVKSLEVQGDGWGDVMLEGCTAVRVSARSAGEVVYTIYVLQRRL